MTTAAHSQAATTTEDTRQIGGVEVNTKSSFLIVLVTLVLATYAIDYSETEWVGLFSTAIFIGGIALVWFLTRTNPLRYITKMGVAKTVAIVLAYFAVGAGYSMVRWEFRHMSWDSKYERLCREYTTTQKIPMIGGDTCVGAEHLQEWKRKYSMDRDLGKKPVAWSSLNLFQRWVMLWPTDGILWGVTSFVPQMRDMLINWSMIVYTWIDSRYTKGVK
jgi:hypothetical protein